MGQLGLSRFKHCLDEDAVLFGFDAAPHVQGKSIHLRLVIGLCFLQGRSTAATFGMDLSRPEGRSRLCLMFVCAVY